jgi:hypothetical protein
MGYKKALLSILFFISSSFLSPQIDLLCPLGEISYAALTLMRGSTLGQMVRRAIRMS